MWVRTLVGAYAGQIRDYSTECGLRAIRSGMGERVEGPEVSPMRVVTHASTAMVAPVVFDKKRKGRK